MHIAFKRISESLYVAYSKIYLKPIQVHKNIQQNRYATHRYARKAFYLLHCSFLKSSLKNLILTVCPETLKFFLLTQQDLDSCIIKRIHTLLRCW